jgi:transglutaminase-like putative cysteine protease
MSTRRDPKAMVYDITLKFGYDYPSAVKDARHILRLRPRETKRQHVASKVVRVDPEPDETVRESDFFGNGVDHLRLYRPHESLKIEMRARIAVKTHEPDLGATPSIAALRKAGLLCRDTGAQSPVHFLGASRMLPGSPLATAFYKERLPDPDEQAGPALLRLTKETYEAFTYASGTTTIETPVDTVMTTRKGVCQDFAHAMISGLRGAGIPAAYVSGFLRTIPPKGQPRLEGADAMHAWIAVWLGEETGWVGFDPTNGVAAAGDHIEVAIGRDYADVAPIGGVIVTSGPQRLTHSVDVAPVEEAG